MPHCDIIFVVAAILVLPKAVRSGENYGVFNLDKLDNPFAFHLFENFDITRKVFVSEQSFVKDLKSVKDMLVKIKKILSDILSNKSREYLPPLAEITAQFRSASDRIDVTTKIFPTATDFAGAVNGMVLLYDTYKFDLSHFLEGRIMVYNIPAGEFVTIQSRHNVTGEDLLTLANASYNKTWFDDSIMFLGTYLDLPPAQKLESEAKKVETMRKNLVELNNQYITKKKVMVDNHYKVLSYVVNKRLKRKAKQPKSVAQVSFAALNSAQGTESYFRAVCNGFSAKPYHNIPIVYHKCHYLHHEDPFLKLGPFKYEIASASPYIIVMHDIFTENEMKYLVETSRPNLSRSRYADAANVGQLHEFKSGKKRRIVHKTVQHWITEIAYNSTSFDPLVYDNDNTFSIKDELLFKLSKKLALATSLNVTSKFASTPFQTTNYGLAGLCETHIDPHGYHDGAEIPESRKGLIMSGDIFATVMGWIEDAPVGGATAFVSPMDEVTVWPRKGSAAFWFSLDKKGWRDGKTVHGGCPVLQGSKWILNKWLYYYDQVKKFPCGLTPTEFVPPFSGHY